MNAFQVVAQVMESEKSQRLLLSECSSLRMQVQTLATHNKKLKEQKVLSIDAQFSNRKGNVCMCFASRYFC